jgi:hypothetical protein
VRLLGLTALFSLACASAANDRAPLEDRPFIKLAKREMALLVYWRGDPEPGYHQALERSLARRLKSAYHTEPLTRRIEGAYAALDPQLVLELVEHGIDDVVLVETRKLRDGVGGRVVIRALATDEIVQKLSIPPIRGKQGLAPEAERVADFVALKITHHWTDPGSAPLLDELQVANRLAAAKACEQALAIYRKVFAHQGVVPVNEIDRESAAQSLHDRCEREVAMRAELEADRRATYAIELDAQGMSKTLAEGLGAAVIRTKLEEKLRPHSDKPIVVRFRPGELLLDVRYQVERYRGANSSRPKLVDGHPALHLQPYVPLMEALLELKETLAEIVPAYDRQNVEETATLLHLRKPFGSWVQIGFADDPGLLISDEVRVKLGHRDAVTVASVEPRVTRTQRFLLGPPTEADGSLTTYGLLWEFFELDR